MDIHTCIDTRKSDVADRESIFLRLRPLNSLPHMVFFFFFACAHLMEAELFTRTLSCSFPLIPSSHSKESKEHSLGPGSPKQFPGEIAGRASCSECESKKPHSTASALLMQHVQVHDTRVTYVPSFSLSVSVSILVHGNHRNHIPHMQVVR